MLLPFGVDDASSIYQVWFDMTAMQFHNESALVSKRRVFKRATLNTQHANTYVLNLPWYLDVALHTRQAETHHISIVVCLCLAFAGGPPS